MRARIQERGNCHADVGDYVSVQGDLYRVISLGSGIHTGQSGSGASDYQIGEIEPADWSDLSDEEAEAVVCSASFLAQDY